MLTQGAKVFSKRQPKKPTILVFTENYYQGGLDTFVVNLLNYWPDRQVEFVVACNAGHPGAARYQADIHRNATIVKHRIPTMDPIATYLLKVFPKDLVRLFTVLLRYPLMIVQWLLIKLLLYQVRPDYTIVVNGGYPGGSSCRAACIAAGKKVVLSFHNDAISPRFPFVTVETLIDSLVARAVSAAITVSKHTLETLSLRPAFAGSVKRVIANGVAEPAAATGLSVDPFPYVLMLATYEPRKGHLFALEVFRQVLQHFPSHRLIMAGYGSVEELEAVKRRSVELDIADKVIVDGFRNDTARLLRHADVLIVPSQAFESFGLTIIEAMSLSVPVVATKVGGIPEVLPNGEGGFCVEKNVQEFADAVIKLLADPGLRRDIGALGRRRYESCYSASLMSNHYFTMLKNLGYTAPAGTIDAYKNQV